jgi:hypothetical protein
MTWTEPTNEQLANFACVMISGPGAGAIERETVKDMFDNSPTLRESWLGYHQEFQRKADELDKELRKDN